MGDFRSFKTARRAARRADASRSSIPPAGPPRASRTFDNWSYRITRARRRRTGGGGRGGAPQRRRHGRHQQGGFPAQVRSPMCCVDVRRELMDGRGIVMMQDFPLDRFDREEHRDRLYRARRLSRPDHVAEQARPHPRPREGSRRRLQRSEHPRLHDQCRDALPHRRLRLCRPALPADVDDGRREPDRELGDGLQHACSRGGPTSSRR